MPTSKVERHASTAWPAPWRPTLQAEAQQQLAEQRERRARAAQRCARLLKQLQAQGAAAKLPAGLSLEALAADVHLAQLKEATKGMLEALRAAAAQHPELNLLQRAECEAGMKLPAVTSEGSRPGSAARSVCSAAGASSRPLSGRSSPGVASRPQSGAAACRLSTAAAGRGCSPGSSRPGSSGSVRSGASQRGGSPAKSASVQTVQLQL